MDFSTMHFYKHMSGFFMHSISFPEKLTRQFAHLAGKVLQLKRSSGDTWHVGLVMSGDKLALQPGWNDFASANKLSQNDHLVFKFIGESKFEVFIFDPAGCEKGGYFENEEQELNGSLGSIVGEELSKELYSFEMTEKDEWHEFEGGSETRNDSVPIEELHKNYQKGKLHKCKTMIQKPNEKAINYPSKELEEKEEVSRETTDDSVPIGKLFHIHSEESKHHVEMQSEIMTPPMKRPRHNPSSLPSKRGKKMENCQPCYNNYTSKIELTAEQKNRAEQLTCKVQANNPYFLTVFKKYNLTSYQMSSANLHCSWASWLSLTDRFLDLVENIILDKIVSV